MRAAPLPVPVALRDCRPLVSTLAAIGPGVGLALSRSRSAGEYPARPRQQLAAAVGAEVLHFAGASGAESALVTADPCVAVMGQGLAAALTCGSHLKHGRAPPGRDGRRRSAAGVRLAAIVPAMNRRSPPAAGPGRWPRARRLAAGCRSWSCGPQADPGPWRDGVLGWVPCSRSVVSLDPDRSDSGSRHDADPALSGNRPGDRRGG
jgi:hypothetical protein